MSLVSITRANPAALKEIARNLDRIATAMETFLLVGYDIHTQGQKPDTSGEEPEASYTDDEKAWTQEYLAKLGRDEADIERLTKPMDEDV